ncbi:MAG: hypothetical protein AAF483_05145 [Planctomycetota bacterium]
MPATESDHESIEIDGGILGKLSFSRSGDRYKHRWDFPNSPIQIHSVESSSDELWPSSPPLQQIHQQSFADGREVIFGVGMAGRGHWSASFTLVPDLKCWIVELACRSSIVPDKLESTYRVNHSDSPELASTELCLDSESGIHAEAIAPSSKIAIKDKQLVFSPAQIQENSQTLQWAFRLRVSG